MAWNGSDSGNGKAEEKKNVRSSTSTSTLNYKALMVGLIVVLAGGLVAWLMLGNDETPTAPKAKTPPKSSRITEATPAPAPKAEPEKKVEYLTTKRGVKFPKPDQPVYQDPNGVWRYVKGNARVPIPVDPKNRVVVSAGPTGYPEFKHACENELAGILVTTPGDALIGDFNYDKEYRDDFVQALMEPIEILDTDSESDKELKRSVEELKHELAQRIKNGEDLGQIMQEARDESRRMANYKSELKDLFDDAIESGSVKSAQDADDLLNAANKMLEERGIEGFKMTKMMRKRIERQILNAKEANNE